jgi:hypothetical protein
MTDDEDDNEDDREVNFSEPTNLIHEHYNYMALRENMQEFPGRVPTRKRKKESENPQQDSNKPKVRFFDFTLSESRVSMKVLTPSHNYYCLN